MIDKPDPKDAGRSDPGAKRPHATLDLKATEVKPAAPPASSAPAGASSSTSASSATLGSGASSADAKTGTPQPPPSSSSSSAKPAPGTADAKSAAAPKPTSAQVNDAKAAPRKSGGGFFSHTAAGLVGGGLVYVATGLLGLPPPGLPGSAASDLAQRVAALEAAPKDNAGVSDLAARLGEAESRLAKLGEIEQRVGALDQAQGTLAAETKALAETAKEGGDSASVERLAKLEEQLRLIASGAPDAEGRVPQLAAIAGKISDLESALATQIASLRKSMPAEIEERLATTAEASEAAKAAAQRLDREVATARTEQARGLQKVETQKAETDRLAAAVEAAKEETGRLASTVAELRSSFDSQLKAVARPADVSAAVGPVHNKIAELEQNVQGVMRSEQSRRENAERIVLSLELSNLKRVLDRGQGQGYAAELEEVRKASAGTLDLAALERFKDTGVASESQLKAEFRPVMNAVIDADLERADGSVIDRLLAGAKSVVRVRKVSHDAADTSTEAIVARIETALNEGRLGDVVTLAKTLPQKAQIPVEDWLIKVTARHSVDQAIASIDDRLKASLSGAPDPVPSPPPASPAPAAPAPAPN